LYPRKMLRKQ